MFLFCCFSCASPDGSYVAAGGADGTIFIWNARTAKLEHTVQSLRVPVTAVAWHPSGHQVRVCCSSMHLHVRVCSCTCANACMMCLCTANAYMCKCVHVQMRTCANAYMCKCVHLRAYDMQRHR